MGSLTDVGKNELNALNINLVHQLKSADTAFSLGRFSLEIRLFFFQWLASACLSISMLNL